MVATLEAGPIFFGLGLRGFLALFTLVGPLGLAQTSFSWLRWSLL